MTTIDWQTLKDKTGKATGVGQSLVGLQSADAAVRQQAITFLEKSLYEQKQWYSGAVAAIPELAALASESKIPERNQLIALIANIVTSDHRGLIATGYDRNDEKLEPVLSQKGAQQALSAATAETARWLVLLTDPEPKVRTASAFLLAFLPDSGAVSIPALEHQLQTEADPHARGSSLLSLGILSRGAEQSTKARLARSVASAAQNEQEPPLVRGVAALSQLYFDASALPSTHDALLLELVRMGDLGRDVWPWIFGRVDALVSRLLLELAGQRERAATVLTDALLSTRGEHPLSSEWYGAVGELTLGPAKTIPIAAQLADWQRRILVRLADLPRTSETLRGVPRNPTDYRCWLGLEAPGQLEQEVDLAPIGQNGRGPLWKLIAELFLHKGSAEVLKTLSQILDARALASTQLEIHFSRYGLRFGTLSDLAKRIGNLGDSAEEWALGASKEILRLRPELVPGHVWGAGNILLAHLPASITGREFLDEPWQRLVSLDDPEDLARRFCALLRPELREAALLRLLARIVDDGDVNQALLLNLAATIDLSPTAPVVKATLDVLEQLLEWSSIDDEAAQAIPTICDVIDAARATRPEIEALLSSWALSPEKQARLAKARQGETRLDE